MNKIKENKKRVWLTSGWSEFASTQIAQPSVSPTGIEEINAN